MPPENATGPVECQERDPINTRKGIPSTVIKELDAILKDFDPISLQEMENVKLLDRVDTKFTFRIDQLADILEKIVPHYRILDVNGVRANQYQTLYFDTDNFGLYARHHSGKFTRYKVRYRRYVDSNLCFFEIKAKNNKGRTIKQRIQRSAICPAIETEAAELLTKETALSATDFKPRLWANFTRLTFAGKFIAERLTLDIDLAYKNGPLELNFPKLVIAEVKQDKSSFASPFIRQMRQRRIWEGSMSKYCFGVVNLYPRIKMNLFKERIRQLKLLAA